MLIGIIINSNVRFCDQILSSKLLGDAPPEPQTYISNANFRSNISMILGDARPKPHIDIEGTVKFNLTLYGLTRYICRGSFNYSGH